MSNIDRLFNTWIGLEHVLANQPARKTTFPPYNTYKKDNSYVIMLAVAGYNRDELEVTYHHGELKILGTPQETDEMKIEYIHRGIAKRKFMQIFNINAILKITSVKLQDGLLTIVLTPPEEIQETPEKIKIE